MSPKVSEETLEGGVTLKMHEDTKVSDVAGADKVVIGRDKEGEILVVMPPSVLATTFMLLAGNHMPVTCAFVGSLAYHMGNDDVLSSGIATSDLLDVILKSVRTRHDDKDFEQTHIFKGTTEEFDGLYWGTMQPIELAGVAVVMQEILDGAGTLVKNHPTVYSTMKMWVEASERFVNDIERMALFGEAKGTA